MAFHRGRARTAQPGRPARSGIRTRGGQYKKFDSQRIKEVEPESEDDVPVQESESELEVDEESDEQPSSTRSYTALLASLKPQVNHGSERPKKRRKLSTSADTATPLNGDSDHEKETSDADRSLAGNDAVDADDEDPDVNVEQGSDDGSDSDERSDPYEQHFQWPESGILQRIQRTSQPVEIRAGPSKTVFAETLPDETKSSAHKSIKLGADLHIKQRLKKSAQVLRLDATSWALAPYLFNYVDLLYGIRTPGNATDLRRLASLHAVNHILIGRDKVIKNTARLAQADDSAMLEIRDQGFTRPKVLILTETRQMCAKYAAAIVEIFAPEQQENSKRFNEAFHAESLSRDMPEDYQELFEGNNDNNFLTTIKFTRKTLKFYSAFYQSDIIFASPVGLQRIIESEDKRKRDHDFLSSIEVLIIDQADAMQMQNIENLELVFKHLNLQPKELRDCDMNRVRSFYLDGHARYLRQTIVLSAYLTPELNKLYNSTMNNVAGKVKVTKQYPGVLELATGLGIKQTFSRFFPKSPADDPDARFEFFTTSVLPRLLRLARPNTGGQGVLIFIPSYFDFLRVRNFFAISTMTENISFGAIHDYSEVSDQRRARSHFLSGRHSILLYTQRAHHFFRLRLRGVMNICMYGIPDNGVFYQEIVADFLSSSISQQQVSAAECTARSIFSKYDALKMERIVGTSRVKNMLGGIGDTFDFV